MQRVLCLAGILACLLAASASAHEHKAPHGGTLVELGEEFAHLEISLDAKTGELTAYVLDGEAENPIRLTDKSIDLSIENIAPKNAAKQPLAIALNAVASALTGEKVGDTSEFSATVEALKGATGFDATIAKLTIKGKTFEMVKFNFPKGNEDEHK